MLVDVAPPVVGQRFGLGGRDITDLVISARYRGSTLFPVSEWPCHVYIARIRDPLIATTLTFTDGQVELIGWGMIFRSVADANA